MSNAAALRKCALVLAGHDLSMRGLTEALEAVQAVLAAPAQVPAVMIAGKKIAWNPDYQGPYEGEFYAAPVMPADRVAVKVAALLHLADGLDNLARNVPDDYLKGYALAMVAAFPVPEAAE